MPDSQSKDDKHVVMLVTNPVRSSRPDPRVFREAKALRAGGYRVTVLAWDRESEERPREVLDDIEIIRIQSSAGYGTGASLLVHLPRYWREAAETIRGLEWTCVHCHDLDTLPVGYYLARKNKKPVIFDSHESYPDYVSPRAPRIVVAALRMLERFLVKRVNAVIAVGESMADKFHRLGSRNTVVIGSWHNPSELRISDERRSQIRTELGVAGLMVVYIGSFGNNRAVLELIEAVKQMEGVTLVIAGDGNLRPEVERQIAGVRAIKDLGTIPYARALEIKACADVVYRVTKADVVPNAKYSAPNNLFEALAAGAALIGGDNGDIGRIIREERCGVALSDITSTAIKAALDKMKDECLLDEMRANALAAAHRLYNWNEASRRLLSLYDRLCRR